MAIPKILHFCWFGGKELPKATLHFIETWKENCPDYQIIRWDESNFDVNAHTFTKEAYEKKLYGFVSDFFRIKVLYEMGGIYIDADIKIKKNLDKFLDADFIIGFMDNATIATSFIGASKGLLLLKEMLKEFDSGKAVIGIQNNFWTTEFLLEHYPNFRLTGKTQEFAPHMFVYQKEYFDRPSKRKNLGYATHHYFGSWYGKNPNRVVTYGILEMPIANIAKLISLWQSPFYKIYKKHKKLDRKDKQKRD